ncbi:MAG: hypothetical protein K2J39_08435 [Ruminococcus sp.]|nr:hypothetical protein [Ruminococcus sp.]
MEIPEKTLFLIVIIVIFTVTFITSAVVTYRIRRKISAQKKNQERKDKTS